MTDRRLPRMTRWMMAAGSALAAIALAPDGALAPAPARASDPITVDGARELMIVHPAVVDPFLNGGRSHNGTPQSEGGPWSLRYLLKFLVNNQSETGRNTFYATFFEQWLTAQTDDNGVTVPARDPALVRQLMLDQFSYVDATTGKRVFQMWKLPFELMAIVYRPDLRAADGSDAGELRFVYKLVGPDGEDLKFTLNMEYKLATNYFDTLTWANNWHRLGTMAIGSVEYLNALQRLTWWNTTWIFDDEPDLRHIRTNELAFDASAGGVWQLREFKVLRISTFQRKIIASSVENTPARGLNNTAVLADFIAANPVLGAPGTDFMKFEMPQTLATAAGPITFLDGNSEAGIRWTVPGEDPMSPSVAVDNLGLLTCNGCHQNNKSAIPGEIEFYHVRPDTSPGQDGTPRLSKFLTTPDPDPARTARRPGDLARRQTELGQLLSQPWTPYWIP